VLRAGISTFDLSRYMGASLTMIERQRMSTVDAAWTPKAAAAAT
jgi:hypothetical protein